MIILDTNVVSALMRREPDAAVLRWLDGQPAESLWLTSVTVLEVLLGIALLPIGRRQRRATRGISAISACRWWIRGPLQQPRRDGADDGLRAVA